MDSLSNPLNELVYFDKNGLDKSGTHWLQYAVFNVTVFAIYFGQLT